MLKQQTYFPKNLGTRDVARVGSIGVEHAEGICVGKGKSWNRYQACRRETFSLVALEGRHAGVDQIGYTKQEDYIKICFWLSGRHTTILNGFGQLDHERPEIFITSGPMDMIKVDVLNKDSRFAAVALCLLRDFFPVHMGIELDRLPEPLRALLVPQERPLGFHSFALTPDILAATRAILAAPFAARQQPLYAEAKAIELMCLLINRLGTGQAVQPGGVARLRRESRLHEAREFLARHYAEPVTLERVSKEVGLNKMALTSGFRQLFGLSVYDCLQKERMDRAYELLQDETYTIAQVAEAVGYGHSCNFSTAFRATFGCSPHQARAPVASE